MPLLLDLARKRLFLHDASMRGLDSLLDPRRGSRQPHPFYEADRQRRADLVAFLRGVDTTNGTHPGVRLPPQKDMNQASPIKLICRP